MTNIDPSHPSAADEKLNRQWINFQRYWALAVFSLMIATWRLWVPVTDFPSVPMVDLQPWFGNCDRLAVAGIVMSLGVIALTKRRQPIGHCVLIVSFLLAFVLNQHRMQPWAYQAVLYGIAFATMKPCSVRVWLIAITISIYVYSACGKFDFQFLHTVGQEFVSIALGPNADPYHSVSMPRLILAFCLPVAELAIGIGLCLPMTRRIAGLAAMLMHASLVVVLGPWNLDHSLGVLMWNIWLLVQSWFLFVSPMLQSKLNEHEDAPQLLFISSLVAKSVLVVAMLLPLLERTGCWDHWLSWSLYAPHTSRVEIEVHEIAIDALPASIRPFVTTGDDDNRWYRVSIDRWSLEIAGVPIYPQARFQLGVAQSIAKKIASRKDGAGDGIRVKIRSTADRWTGTRKEQWLQGRDEIDQAAEKYWLLGTAR